MNIIKQGMINMIHLLHDYILRAFLGSVGNIIYLFTVLIDFKFFSLFFFKMCQKSGVARWFNWLERKL